jgi:endopeptidase Clp ATP-binding regulatory subunit ClpX
MNHHDETEKDNETKPPEKRRPEPNRPEPVEPREPNGFPSPEQLQKEFQEMVQKKFGGVVQVVSLDSVVDREKPEEEPPAEQPRRYNFTFDYTPKEIVEFLNQSIIGQDEAKKALALAVCDHYRHIEAEQEGDIMGHYQKQNVLLLGPTGVGKTFLVRSIAQLIGVPFVKADATRFSEVGYMGANVDDIVRDLIQQAKGDFKLAENGIVYVDEVDKIAAAPNRIGRDVSGRGVQFGFLRLLEDAEVDINSSHDIASQFRTFMNLQKKGQATKEVVRTKNILFIFSGAFPELTEIIKKRLAGSDIGIHSSLTASPEDEASKYFTQVQPQDLVKFGFEQEFIGRLPVITSCQNLTVDELFAILKYSEASIIRQYIRSFKHYGIDLRFSDEALKAIARKAHEQRTGARALVSVCESTLRDFKYEMPGTKIHTLDVTPELVENPKGFLQYMLNF